MIPRTDITAVILAGGPAQKAGGVASSTQEVDGRKILERQAQLLKSKVSRIEVSVSAPAPWSRFPVVLDSFDPIGPLAGIATALKYAATDYILAIAAHYAWISPDALDLLIARSGEPFDACAVRFNFATPKPQFAIYHKRAAQRAVERIERGEHDAEGLLTSESLAVRWIEDYELQSFDPELSTFKVFGGATPSPVQSSTAPPVAASDAAAHAFPFQGLEVYQSAIAFLPLATGLAKLADPELGKPLVRAAVGITVAIAEHTLSTARSQTLTCAALLDGMRAVGIGDPRIAEGQALLARIAAQLG
jgi:molybdopterin-guanine dinucleotide biosynthesis protein A